MARYQKRGFLSACYYPASQGHVAVRLSFSTHEQIRYSCHGKGEGQYVGVGEKDIGCASCSSWA